MRLILLLTTIDITSAVTTGDQRDIQSTWRHLYGEDRLFCPRRVGKNPNITEMKLSTKMIVDMRGGRFHWQKL